MKKFVGKKALIVGASGGMGSAVATMLAENGVSCALAGRDKQKLVHLARNSLKLKTSLIIFVRSAWLLRL